jgi:outer membrane protein, heavy metal efflux system
MPLPVALWRTRETATAGGSVFKKVIAVMLASAALLAGDRAAGQEPVRRVTLEEALSLFGSNNLELLISRANAAEASGSARQLAAYPNPGLTVSHEGLSNGPLAYRESYVTLSQRFDWPWMSAARRAAAGHRMDAGRSRVAADSVRLAFDVRRTFVEAQVAEDASVTLAEATQMVRTAERQATDRAAAGDIAGYDLRRLRVERLRYEYELSAASLRLLATRRRLASLILPNDSSAVAPARDIQGQPGPISLATALHMAQSHAERGEASALIASARDTRRAAGAERVPVPTLAAGYKTQTDGFGGTFVSAGISLPLFDRRSAAVAAAQGQVRVAETRWELVARQIENEVRRTHETFTAARARMGLVGTGEEAGALLGIARVAYAEGAMSLVELLDAVNVSRLGRLAVSEARGELWISFFDLERAVGRSLADVREDR